MADNPNLKVYITIEALDEYSKKMKSIKKQVKDFETESKTMNDNIARDQKKSVDKQISNYEKLKKVAIAYFSFSYLKSAVQATAYRDKYLSKIKAITHGTSKEIDKFNQELRSKSKDSIHSVDEILSGAFVGAKAGVKIDELANFSKVVDQVFTAVSSRGGETMEQTASAMGSVINSFNGDLSDLSDVMARVIDTTRGMNINEFAQSLAKTAPYTKKFNTEMESVMAVVGRFVETGFSGAVASTKMQSIFKALEIKGVGNIGKQVGLGADFKLEGKGFLTLLQKLKDQYGNLSSDVRMNKLSKLFGAGQASVDLSNLIGDLDNVNTKYDDLIKKSKGFRESASLKISEGAYGNYMKLMNTLDNIKTTIGSIVYQSGLIQFFGTILSIVDNILSKILGIKNAINSTVDKLPQGKTKDVVESGIGGVGTAIQGLIGAKVTQVGLKKIFGKEVFSNVAKGTVRVATKIPALGRFAPAIVGAIPHPATKIALASATAAYYGYQYYKSKQKNKQHEATDMLPETQSPITMSSITSLAKQPKLSQDINIVLENKTNTELKVSDYIKSSDNTNVITRQNINNR